MLLFVAYSPSACTYILEDYTKGITIYRHMDLSLYIWITIILYEHNSDETICWRENFDCPRGPFVAPSILTFHFDVYVKSIYPNRNIVLIFWQRKNVDHHCGPSLMVHLSWVVVIDHTIFLMRRVFIWYISIEVDGWWFDMGYRPPDYSYMKVFINFLLLLHSKTAPVVAYMNYTNFHLFLY